MLVQGNIAGLLHILKQVEGRKFIRAVDGGDCVELVFSGDRGNLVTIWPHGTGPPHEGDVALGYIHVGFVAAGYGVRE